MLLVVAVGYQTSPESLQNAFAKYSESLVAQFDRILYERRFRFENVKTLQEESLLARLPKEGMTLWWHLDTSHIEQFLKQDPYVKDAVVKRCTFFSWSCFTIDVKERQPAFLTKFGKRNWIVSSDGGFLTPATGSKESHLPYVDGVLTSSGSPELVHSRLAYVAKAIDVIEEQIGLRLKTITLTEEAELTVTFRELPFTVVFEGKEGELRQLQGEAKRLRSLLAKLDTSKKNIEQIDLAYKRLAVLKVKDRQEAAQQSSMLDKD